MTQENDIELGGYYGIHREVVYVEPNEVIVRFYPFGEYDSDIEFVKKYETKQEALDSIKKYMAETTLAKKEEISPIDGDWKAFAFKVNESMIRIFKDAIEGNLFLPDNGIQYTLKRRDMDELKYWVNKSEKGEEVQFVKYNL